jgi:hypothetical protein
MRMHGRICVDVPMHPRMAGCIRTDVPMTLEFHFF